MTANTEKSALGFVELPSLCNAITVLDTMLKAAAVTFVTWEKKLGGRLVTIIVSGTVSSVTAAVDAVAHNKDIKSSLVIPAPHPEIWKMVRESAAKIGGIHHGKTPNNPTSAT
ncbi:MAG: BMC domain-containing protein [Defluviitaleaceae bacterium]|nr:BMC domain-containing protein [Defluviitaleaceae bacterium]